MEYTTQYRYAKANKYMKNYDKNIELSQLMYLDANNFYGWKMLQKLPANGLSKFDEKFIKNYDEDSNKEYILEVDAEYLTDLHNLHSDLPFLSERMRIKKCNKLLYNLHDKKEYFVHIRALKQALNHGLIFKKVQRVIQFDQEAWLKPYIKMNTTKITEAKNDFEKDFFKLMNNSVSGKTMENVRKHSDIKLATTDEKENQLVSEPNYHTTK